MNFLSCSSAKKDTFLSEIGVCTSVSNADMLAENGYAYIEESVGSFLMPTKSEAEFTKVLQQAQTSAIPLKACTNFIPGSLKSVGPDAVHPEILEFMEIVFRRAQQAGVEYIVFRSGGSRGIPEGFLRDKARRQFIDLCTKIIPIAASYDVVLVIVSSAWPRRVLLAIRPDGQGNLTESHVVWRSTVGGVYVPSPITTGDYLFTTMTNGKVHCMDVATGEVIWIEELGLQYSSPVIAGGLLYMPNDEGVITVIKPGPVFETIAKNPIGEKMYASPAISNGKIFLRGEKHLYCIGQLNPSIH